MMERALVEAELVVAKETIKKLEQQVGGLLAKLESVGGGSGGGGSAGEVKMDGGLEDFLTGEGPIKQDDEEQNKDEEEPEKVRMLRVELAQTQAKLEQSTMDNEQLKSRVENLIRAQDILMSNARRVNQEALLKIQELEARNLPSPSTTAPAPASSATSELSETSTPPVAVVPRSPGRPEPRRNSADPPRPPTSPPIKPLRPSSPEDDFLLAEGMLPVSPQANRKSFPGAGKLALNRLAVGGHSGALLSPKLRPGFKKASSMNGGGQTGSDVWGDDSSQPRQLLRARTSPAPTSENGGDLVASG
eukprot:GABV01008548.1.p1 GENE.GABV01008548.1~~GABV01008548.1.p1  ORF type:complete len:304 (-),score=82.68 GABV01008548.1:125-1036(-)